MLILYLPGYRGTPRREEDTKRLLLRETFQNIWTGLKEYKVGYQHIFSFIYQIVLYPFLSASLFFLSLSLSLFLSISLIFDEIHFSKLFLFLVAVGFLSFLSFFLFLSLYTSLFSSFILSLFPNTSYFFLLSFLLF